MFGDLTCIMNEAGLLTQNKALQTQCVSCYRGAVTLRWIMHTCTAHTFNHGLLQLISSLVGNMMCGKNAVVLVVPENLSRIPISRQQTSHFNSSFSQWQFTLQQFSLTSPANGKCWEMIAANMLLYLWNSKTLRQFQLVNVFYYQAFKKSSVSRVFIWHDQALKEKY